MGRSPRCCFWRWVRVNSHALQSALQHRHQHSVWPSPQLQPGEKLIAVRYTPNAGHIYIVRAADWRRLGVIRGHGERRAVFGGRRPRERAALLGCCTGAHAAALPLALSQAALGAEGLQLAALFCLFNSIAGTPSSTNESLQSLHWAKPPAA